MSNAIARWTIVASLAGGVAWGQLVSVNCTPSKLPEIIQTVVSVSCGALGGLPPYTWTVSAGSLPPGLSLDANGNITGTLVDPAGPYSFTVTATDSTPILPQQGSSSFSGTTVDPLTVNCTSASGPLEVTVPYTNSCTAAGGTPPYTWSLTGQLVPPGMTIPPSGNPVTINYTPTASLLSYQYRVVATDSGSPPLNKGELFTGAIGPAITTTSPLPPATQGSAYSQQFAASAGTPPYTWSASGLNGSGLNMSPAGLLSGKPTTAGTVNFNVTVADTAGGVSGPIPFSLTVSSAGLTITTTSPLPPATVGAAYSQTFAATGGSGTGYTWSITGQPAWLTMSAAGVLSGNPPPSAVDSTFTVTVTDSASNTASGPFTLPVTLAITTPAQLSSATIGTLYNQTLTAVGGSGGYTWAVTTGTLPAGLSLSPAGVISGTPLPAALSSTFTATVTDSSKVTASLVFTLPVTLTITTTSPLPAASVGTPYSQTLTARGGAGGYTWSATGLPSWLTLSAAGVLSGTPPTGATPVNFTAKVTDSASVSTTATFTIPLGLAITTTSLPNGTTGVSYSATLTATGGTTPYTWTIASGGLPTGLALSTAGTISGKPTATGTFNFTVQVSDNTGAKATQPLALTIVTGLTFSNTSPLPSGEAGIPYTETFTVTGGIAPYSFVVTGGSVPPGLSLSGNGILSGTPSVSGTYNFTVQATDLNHVTVSAPFTLTIAGALTIATPPTLSSGSINAGYSQALSVNGGVGPFTWALTGGSTPPGLTLSSAGIVTGFATTAGTFSFTAKVTDSAGATASRTFTIDIVSGLTVSSPPTLPGATAGTSYSFLFTAAGGVAPFTWLVSSGSPPAGLSLGADGTLSGTPTTPGTYTFTVQVSDSAGSHALEAVTITIAAAPSITTASLASGTPGAPYSQSLNVSGGTPPYTWTIASGALPGGLSLSAAGLITGTPEATGTFTFTVKVTDSASASASKQLNITVGAGSALAITTAATLPNAPLNGSYSQALAASGGTPPYAWAVTAGALPAGLGLSAAGTISGTATAAGAFTFTATVTDSVSATASQQFTLSVGSGLAITTTSLPGGKPGTPYSQTLDATGGTPPYTFAVTAGSPPPGISLSGNTLGGTPTTNGTYTFTVQVTDSASATATQQLSITIAGLAITTGTTLPGAAVGTPYSVTLTAAGSAPFTWAVTQGTPADGLSLAASTGKISGTPGTAGSSTFTVQVTDSTNATASASFTLAVVSGSFSGLSATAASSQQLSGTLALGAAFPADITGQITLTFQPDASLAAPSDDPAIQFAAGGRTSSISIPANSTTPVAFALQTGTVAGTITLSVNWQSGGATLAVPPGLTQTIQIAPAAPAISAITASTTSSGFQVQITAYSNTRELTQAQLQFTAAPGQTLETTSLTVSLSGPAASWFQSGASDQYGSQFILTLPFTVSNGTASAIASVSVQLVNGQGTSASSSATLQ